jgi:hypothetical protein
MKKRGHATGSVATLVARAFAVAFTVVGCGKVSPSGGGGGGTGGTTIDQACTMLAQTECAKRDSCSNGTNIKRSFGDLGTCMARATLLCADALRAPGTGNSPTVIPQCISDYATLSCNDFFDGKLPDSCTPSGSVATGQPCGFNGQCQTAFCGNLKSSVCGTCAATPTVGSSCATSACDHGQTCLDATMICAANGIFNAPCNAGMPCGSGLSCVMATSTMGGDAGTDGTCQKAISQLGAACGGTLPGCDGSLGFYCGGTNGSRTCMATAFVGNGQPCGGLSSTSFTQCLAGSCFTGTGVVAVGPGNTGTCKADVTEGAACDSVVGPFCQMPARCVTTGNGSAGLCMLANGICN